MNKKIILLIVLIFSLMIYPSDPAGKAGAFLRYGLDARSESLGRSVTADDNAPFSAFFNPSVISTIDERQIFTGMKILSMDRKFIFLSYAQPVTDQAALSGGILYTGTDGIEGRDRDGDLYDTFSYNQNLFYLNFGIKPKEFLSIGVTAKLMWSRLPEFDSQDKTVSSLTFAYDAGFTFFFPGYDDLIFGLSVKNVKGKNSWDSSKVWSDGTASDDYYPAGYSVGIMWNPPFNKDIKMYADIRTDDMYNTGYGAGIEWVIRLEDQDSSVALRSGSNSGQLTAGIGYQTIIIKRKMSFDYSFTHEDISEFDPHSITWSFFF